jgi:hypothetical protein
MRDQPGGARHLPPRVSVGILCSKGAEIRGLSSRRKFSASLAQIFRYRERAFKNARAGLDQ